MSSDVAIALIGLVGTIVTVGLPAYVGYRKLDQKLDSQHGEVKGTLDATTEKLVETTEMNRVQIHASNNLNEKISKLHQATNQVANEVHQLRRDVKTLSDGTGIPVGK